MRWCLWLTLALVVLAGCGSLFADGDGSDESADGTLTAVPVPEVTPTPERWPAAPGLSGRGVVDVDVLVAAHLEAVSNRSYTWREYRGAATVFDAGPGTVTDGPGTVTDGPGTVTDGPGTTTAGDERVRVFPSSVARVESPTTYVAWTTSDQIRIGGAITHVANYTEFAAGDDRYVRYRFPGSPEATFVREGPMDAGYNDIVGEAATDAIRRYLPAENATVAQIRVEGRLYYEVVTHRRDLPGVNGTREYRARAVVSPEGFVRSLNVSYVAVSVGIPRHVRYRFVYDDVDETSVDPPTWVTQRRTGS